MVEPVLLGVMGALFALGIGLGLAGLVRRAWGVVLFAAMLCSVPAGFATVVMAAVI